MGSLNYFPSSLVMHDACDWLCHLGKVSHVYRCSFASRQNKFCKFLICGCAVQTQLTAHEPLSSPRLQPTPATINGGSLENVFKAFFIIWQAAQAQVAFLEFSKTDVNCEITAAVIDGGQTCSLSQPYHDYQAPQCEAAFSISIGTLKPQRLEMVSDAWGDSALGLQILIPAPGMLVHRGLLQDIRILVGFCHIFIMRSSFKGSRERLS